MHKLGHIDAEKLGRRMAEVRSRNFTQEEMADMLATSERTVRNYEKGRTKPEIDTVLLWARICRTSVEYLATGEGVDNLDPVTSNFIKAVTDKALRIDEPAYGVLVRKAMDLPEAKLHLLLDFAEALSAYDVTLDTL